MLGVHKMGACALMLLFALRSSATLPSSRFRLSSRSTYRVRVAFLELLDGYGINILGTKARVRLCNGTSTKHVRAWLPYKLRVQR